MPDGRRLRGITTDVWSANIACIFTLLNLCCGFYAIMMHKMSLTTMDNWALGALLVGFGCDFLDGYLARKKNQTSAFGERLDSLSDLVTFGMAPMFFALSARIEWEVGLISACCLYLVCGAVRLARYDPESQGKMFKGMPIPVAGLTLAAAALASQHARYLEPSYPVAWFDLVPVTLGLMMISDIPFLKVSFAGPKKVLPIGLAILGAVSLKISHGDLPVATLSFTLAYVVICLMRALVLELPGRVRALQEARSAAD